MSRDPFVSYAQNQEDVVLARALRPDDRGGFWVDVGAGDPVRGFGHCGVRRAGVAGRERGTAPVRTRAALRGAAG